MGRKLSIDDRSFQDILLMSASTMSTRYRQLAPARHTLFGIGIQRLSGGNIMASITICPNFSNYPLTIFAKTRRKSCAPPVHRRDNHERGVGGARHDAGRFSINKIFEVPLPVPRKVGRLSTGRPERANGQA